MFNSTAIEVVIGLVFIYILYSLLVTIVTELISSVFNQRGMILKKGIRRMLDDDNNTDNKIELLSDEFRQRPEIKYLGNKFLGKNRIPSYISPSTFSTALLNILRKSGEIDKNLKEYMKTLEKGKENSETKEILYNLMVEANGKIDKFKGLLENWYNETMDRVSGWYKRRIQLITFFIGLVIAFALNVDTIAIAKKLTRESDTRIEMVKMATDFANERNVNDSTSLLVNDEVKQIMQDIKQQESIISISHRPSDPSTKAFWLYVLGCLITTIALSLGAPFWFDILNKISKLRSGGAQVKIDPGKDDKK